MKTRTVGEVFVENLQRRCPLVVSKHFIYLMVSGGPRKDGDFQTFVSLIKEILDKAFVKWHWQHLLCRRGVPSGLYVAIPFESHHKNSESPDTYLTKLGLKARSNDSNISRFHD